jgi:predicted permease
MSMWSRITNVFRGDGASREIDEELESHLEEAIEQGRDPGEARRAFGSPLHHRERSRDVRMVTWLESLRADAVFGWRQLNKRKATSAAAILSLALAIGACTSAFRLIDALLLRPLPVAQPERLYSLSREGVDQDGKHSSYDAFAYPDFALMRAAVKNQAELIAISYAERMDVTYASDQEMEKAHLQYVSGWMFGSFGLQPALGRLFTENDDRKPGAHPYAVLSYDYWTRRFGQDPKVVGRTIRMGSMAQFASPTAANGLYEIIGVAEGPFTGTEPGTVTDIFVPTMMHPGVQADDWTWFRTLAVLKPGVAAEPIGAKLNVISQAFERERAKRDTGLSNFRDETLRIDPAAAGASGLQQSYRPALLALAVLVALVLLIACANAANLMTAQAATRAREMALRVSIGAGRLRLVQMVLVEGAWVGILAAATGAAFAWWSAPFVVARINPPDNPARLSLPADWRVLVFGFALALSVTLLFGLAPALRASGVKPATALKGGEDPHSRRRLMHTLIAAQVAFCFLVLFVAGLFVATFDRLSHRPIGFSADRLLTLETVAQGSQRPELWDQVAQHLRSVPGVEAVAMSGWPLLSGGSWNGSVSIDGAPPNGVTAYFLPVSPGWLDTMRIPLIDGRDFRSRDTSPGVAIVNETFVKQFLSGQHPLGKLIAKDKNQARIVGVVRDAPYRFLRDPMVPVVYVPFRAADAAGAFYPIRAGTFLVRTASANPLALASALRREVPRARPEFRVSNLRTQAELVQAQTVRERLLAMLALFFASVALVLAGVGLYGVLDYTVLQRRREIGIRMALGARASDVARGITVEVFAMVLIGAAAGLVLGMASGRYVASMLYQVKATDASMLALPLLTIFLAALLAAVPAVIRAVRIDPAITLRVE